MTFFFRKLKKTPQRLLISRTDRIGDFVLTLPIFKTLSEVFKIEFSVLCQERVTPLLINNPYVKEIISIDENRSQKSLIDEIRSKGFDALLVLVNNSQILDLLPKLRFISTRIGPISKPSTLFHYTHPALQKRSKSLRNEAEYNLELLRIFGPKPYVPVQPELFFTPKELSDFKTKIQQEHSLFQDKSKLVVLHAGMQGSALNWGISSYARLLGSLLAAGHPVILTGANSDEKEFNRTLIQKIDKNKLGKLVDLSGSLSLRELAILIKLVDLYVGPSTGPTHIAGATGTPLISFYPKIQVQSQKRWEPFLAHSFIFTPESPCDQKFRCAQKKCTYFYCMDQIDPDLVFTEAERFLSGE